jgi:hypothetical protein
MNLAGARWRKSSHSGDSGACVEIALTNRVAGVRDSKHLAGPVLIFPAGPWMTFLRTR